MPDEQNAPLVPEQPAAAPVEQPTAPAAAEQAPRRPRRAYTHRYGDRRVKLKDVAAAQAPDKPDAVRAQEDALRAAGLLGADLPEAEVLENVDEETKAKLSQLEKDKISLADAMARAADIEANDDGTRHGAGNEFYIDPSIVPAGWHYEFKAFSVLNEPQHSHMLALGRSGWQAVPRSRHPHMMPPEWQGDTIMVKGQILMQIPKRIADARRQEELDKARAEVQNKLAQLSGRSVQKDGRATFERNGRAARDFGPILNNNEQAYAGQLVGGQIVPGGRTIAR